MMEISERQLEIIQSAGVILTESGVGGLTTKKLAEKVGFSEAAIYRHFKGKDAIINMLLSYLADNMELRFTAIDPFLSPIDRLRAIFQNQAVFFQKNPHYVVVVFSEGLMAENNMVNNKVMEIMKVKLNHILPIIEAGQKSGDFTKELPVESLASIIMGTFRLMMFKWRISGFKTDIEAKTAQKMNELITLIKAK
ncbi:MAG: TetR/AcrR family transcriptional regulator [Putridiphycobacter sp.]|nr:TetR/AcrR family transcriptional regulator [Putridiphycobacter sp.]